MVFFTTRYAHIIFALLFLCDSTSVVPILYQKIVFLNNSLTSYETTFHILYRDQHVFPQHVIYQKASRNGLAIIYFLGRLCTFFNF